ncbi:MAG: toxin [Oligoflexia bacterium]|nr:toxin [Oligoflexia bacterium]
MKYNFGFDRIIGAIENNLLDVVINPSRKNQRIFIVSLDKYIYAVPFVENDKEIFLKTFYPSRKLNKRYTGGHDNG